MFENEAVCITVATSAGGRPGAILRAQIWNRDGEEHAEVRYEKDGENFVLSGVEALAFLTVVARDAAVLLASPRQASSDNIPRPRRQAGF